MSVNLIWMYLLQGKLQSEIYKHQKKQNNNCGFAIVSLTLIYNLFNKKQNIRSGGLTRCVYRKHSSMSKISRNIVGLTISRQVK